MAGKAALIEKLFLPPIKEVRTADQRKARKRIQAFLNALSLEDALTLWDHLAHVVRITRSMDADDVLNLVRFMRRNDRLLWVLSELTRVGGEKRAKELERIRKQFCIIPGRKDAVTDR